MASVIRAAVGRVASTLNQAVSVASRSLTPQSCRGLDKASASQCSISSTSVLPSSFAVAGRSPTLWSSASFQPSSAVTHTSPILSVASRLSPVNFTNVRHYKVRAVLKKRCSGCYFVKRKGRMFVDCKLKPRHKQMQLMSKRKLWREDYSKGNIRRAIFWKYHRDVTYYKLGDNKFARHDWLKGKIGVTV